MEETAVVVVGAGMAGLIAARELHRGGIDVLVLEAADRLGGRAMSETTSLGSRVDLGGPWIGHVHARLRGLSPIPSAPIGGIHWAGSESAGDHPGYLEGAIESGHRVAREVIAAQPAIGAARSQAGGEST